VSDLQRTATSDDGGGCKRELPVQHTPCTDSLTAD